MMHVAIIGGGYTGTMQAVALLRRPEIRVTLIERADRLARGVAYSTPHGDHLLNVRADRMSAFADAPRHFADWLAEQALGDDRSFAKRRLYGRYIGTLLAAAQAEAGDRLTIVRGDAIDVERADAGERVMLAGGSSIPADRVILSPGNLPPQAPRGIDADALADAYVADPWTADLAAELTPDDAVLLIGSGLTAIDAALMLDSAGFAGRIVAISRRGLVPRAHDDQNHTVPVLADAPTGGCASLVNAVRAQARLTGWHSAVDQLRPHTQALWAHASIDQRRSFLRHLRPWWDVHRHRIAPAIAERITAMEAAGRLTFGAGKLLSVTPNGDGAAVKWRPRGSVESESLRVRRVVNCTGPQGDIERAGEPMLSNLTVAGRIRPDTLRIGIDIDEAARTLGSDGAPSDSLFAIGPMTRGALWEIVAVPDLREQIDRLAQQLK